MQQQLWMTRDEARALQRAEQRGYLVHRHGQQCLAEEWARHCQEQGQPCIRIERTGEAARVILAATSLDAPRQARLKAAFNELGSPEPGSLWPIVHRFGAYSQAFPPARAEIAAQTVVKLLKG